MAPLESSTLNNPPADERSRGLRAPWTSLDWKVGHVRGASSGIDRELCVHLARAGRRIVAAVQRTDELRSISDEINCAGSSEPSAAVRSAAVELDVTANEPAIEASVRRALGAFRRVDAFLNNAGVRGNVNSTLDWSEADWNDNIGTNLTGLWLVSKHVCRLMCDAKQGGSRINFASIGGIDRGLLPGGIAYNATKTDVNAVTKDARFLKIPTCNHCHSSLPIYVSSLLSLNHGLNRPKNVSFSGSRIRMPKLFHDGHSGNPISRPNRIDAQNALFDYLHGTRSLHFTDAEHISKNSPMFLQSLLSQFENEQDIGRSLTRFLRYHPINEFEPFFESLGLKQSEMHKFLPRNMIFLSDDDVLLQNYHVLCNYGVPRSMIGKMYKDGTEMFRYTYDILSSKLQAYEKLGLSKPTIIKLVTCCPTLLVGDLNMEFLQVLEKLKNLGVELDPIRSCLSDKSIYNWTRILEMLSFLDHMGCNKKKLASLIIKHPGFIFDDSGKKMYLLVAVLFKLGLKMNTILVLFMQYPHILLGNFTKNLWQSVHFLVEIGMETEDIARIVSSYAQILGSCSCKQVDTVLENLNISADVLCDIIKMDPTQFSNLVSRKRASMPSIPKVDGIFLKEKTDFLLRLGFVENSDEMSMALSKFRGRGDQLQERFDCIVNAGLDCHTVAEMVKLAPQILNQSSSVIQEKIDYLLNHLGYPLESLVVFPSYLCYSMKKIKLRFSMYNWLKEQGVLLPTKNKKMLTSTLALSTILACSEARFVKYVVDVHPDGPQVWHRLKEESQSLNQEVYYTPVKN